MGRNVKNEILRNNKQFSKMNALYHRLSQKFGIANSESEILYYLVSSEKDVPIQEIIYFTCSPKQTVNSALRNMEKKEWIKLKKIDSKSKLVCLTEKGKKQAEITVEKILAIEEQIFLSFKQEKVEEYLQFTNAFTDKLEEKLMGLEELDEYSVK